MKMLNTSPWGLHHKINSYAASCRRHRENHWIGMEIYANWSNHLNKNFGRNFIHWRIRFSYSKLTLEANSTCWTTWNRQSAKYRHAWWKRFEWHGLNSGNFAGFIRKVSINDLRSLLQGPRFGGKGSITLSGTLEWDVDSLKRLNSAGQALWGNNNLLGEQHIERHGLKHW